MRSNVRRLFSLLLAVALVLGLGLTSVAAIESSLLTLQVTSQHVIRGDEVCVAVNTEAEGVVADGKLTFAYDSKSLKFVGRRGLARRHGAQPEGQLRQEGRRRCGICRCEGCQGRHRPDPQV